MIIKLTTSAGLGRALIVCDTLNFMGDSFAIVGLVWELVMFSFIGVRLPGVRFVLLSLLAVRLNRLGWTPWSRRWC